MSNDKKLSELIIDQNPLGDDDLLYAVKGGASGYIKKSDLEAGMEHAAYIDVPVLYTAFSVLNERNIDCGFHGGLMEYATAQNIANGVPLPVVMGISLVMIVVDAGADTDGTITITGTSVDRITGIESPGDTEDITISGLSTDNTGVGPDGEPEYEFLNAYLSTKKWKGAIVISTTDVDIDIDVYGLAYAFEKEESAMVIEKFCADFTISNTAGGAHFHLHIVRPNGAGKVDFELLTALHLSVADSDADKLYRLKINNLSESLDGTAEEGFLVLMNHIPIGQKYVQDITCHVHATIRKSLVYI